MPEYPTVNTGFIEETRPDDFLAGIIPYRVVLESGDWRPYLPTGEPQFSQVADSQGCVSFSNNNLCEISLRQQGFQYNFSDRALAKLSNTSPAGNTFTRVQNSAFNEGRILEADWALPATFTWATFYAEIPTTIRQKAIFFDEANQFISTNIDNLKYHLKQCPIQIAIPFPHPNHAVVLVHISGSTAWYFDSYPGSTNYLKTMPVGDIQSAMKLIIKPKVMTKYYIIKDGDKLGILISEGYTASIVFAADMPDFEKLKEAVNAPDDMKTVELPQ